MNDQLVGRTGLARLLEVSENTTRSIEAQKLIEPECVVDGRPLFSVAKARKLKSARDARRAPKREV